MVTFHGKPLDKLLEKIGLVTRKRFEAEIAKYKEDVTSKDEELKNIKETMEVFLPLGLETRTSNTVSNIYHYRELYRRFRDNPAKLAEYHEKLKIQLKSLFKDTEIKKRFGYKYRGHEKLIYSLDEVREDLQLEEIILLMQYENEKEAGGLKKKSRNGSRIR